MPVIVQGCDLARILAEAKAAGFYGSRMKALPKVRYELHFFRVTGAGKDCWGTQMQRSPL
jgi:hypothetical protein